MVGLTLLVIAETDADRDAASWMECLRIRQTGSLSGTQPNAPGAHFEPENGKNAEQSLAQALAWFVTSA
jgi:hypothetical protein